MRDDCKLGVKAVPYNIVLLYGLFYSWLGCQASRPQDSRDEISQPNHIYLM
jgi:hypothetical protein